MAFAINHFYTGTRLLVKKSSGIKNYADLAGKTVASTTGTTNVQVLRKYSADHNLGLNIILGKDHDDSLQVEPYACMLRKDDPAFKTLVDGVISGLMKSGEFEKLYNKWFMSPIPPKNINLNLPMSQQLRDNLTAQSDKPAL